MREVSKKLKKKEAKEDKRLREEIENHKCHGCIWGRWEGKYFCMFPSCIRYKQVNQ